MTTCKHKNNRKGQVLVISVVIAITLALTTSYILLQYMFKETNPDQYLGNYQSSIIDSLTEGDKALLYVDQASKMAVSSAIDEYLNGNPKPSTNVEGGDTESEYCGSYVYRMWNTVNKDCYPNYNSQDFALNKLIDDNLAKLTYLQRSDDKYPNLDRTLSQKINYKYFYDAKVEGTTIIATTTDTYNINVFRDSDLVSDSNIIKYLNNKNAFSGQLIWPLAKDYKVSSCFGYRGQIGISGASSDHPAIDISAPKGTAVMAVASGTVTQILYPQWGKVVIDHGGGLSTLYLHMDKIADNLKVGNIVQQGQIIGTVGTRGEYSADDYDGPHLHFAVMSTKVDLETNYKGVKAVLKNMYVNPICFFDQNEIEQNVNFDMTSKACNSICNTDVCYPSSGIDENSPYKFCDLYTDIISQGQTCPPSNNGDLDIIDVRLSSEALTSDQTLKIDIDVKNKGDTCVTVEPELMFTQYASSTKYTLIGKSTNIYVSSNAQPYTSLNSIICTFTSDKDIAIKEMKAGNCVLEIPRVKYELMVEIPDDNADKGSDMSYKEFTVKKVAGESYTPASTQTTSTIQLTKSELTKFEKTKQNLENINIMNYIAEQAQEGQVSKELILGLITQESGGDMHAGSSAGAYGLMQVVKGTFDGTQFTNKCTWTEYQNDAQCQIRAGIAILKQKYSEVNGKDIYYSCNTNCWGTNFRGQEGYWPSCSGGCLSTKCIGPTDKTYSEWEAALRRYNGGGDITAPTGNAQTSGCVGQPDYDYVEHVMKYAVAWGYLGNYDSQIQAEMYAGILGTYTIKPKFNVKINFDMRLLDMLKKFSQDTVKICGVEGTDRKKCVTDQVDAFNKNIPVEYINNLNKIELSQSCDDGPEMKEVHTFVEEVNDCMLSEDNNCRCEITPSDIEMSIESGDDSTKISYDSSGNNGHITLQAYFDYGVIQADSKYWRDEDVKAIDVILIKDDKQLILGDSNNVAYSGTCGVAKNIVRLCLKTSQYYTVYDETVYESIQDKLYTIPFVITIRNDKPPTPLTGLKYENMKHSRNSVILKWPKGKENDIVRYNIYFSNQQTYFSGRPTASFKSIMSYKSISATPENYAEYISIDLNNPRCTLVDSESTDGTSTGTSSTKYCTFTYPAVSKAADTNTNTNVDIQLEEEKLYYLSSTKEFIYILSGKNTGNGLTSGVNKFIAVTAIDIDGNEIDNVKTDEKITMNGNLISVRPENLLEAGLTEITDMRVSSDNRVLTLSWNTVDKNIDGTPLISTSRYKVYIGNFGCEDGEMNALSSLRTLSSVPYSRNTGVGIPITSLIPGDYCIGVSSMSDNNKEYENVLVKHLQKR
jgi:murein DD-endopeptidase MepM/ murein hydrolase activator NlpD